MSLKFKGRIPFSLFVLSLSACTTSSGFDSASDETIETSSSFLAETPISIAENSTTTSLSKIFFELSKPINIEFCYDMVNEVCKQVSLRNSQLEMGYHLPPMEGVPSSWNRDVDFWKSLNETQKNDYLSTSLWNFVARLGIAGGVQSLTRDEILSEYQYAQSNTQWLVEGINLGANPIQLLDTIREEERKQGIQEWLIDWRINASIWVALPAVAPELIPTFDNIIKYKP